MVSDLNQKIYGKIDEWRLRPLVGDFPYVFLDGLWLKRSWGGEVRNSRTSPCWWPLEWRRPGTGRFWQ